jgi:hypothetical protein
LVLFIRPEAAGGNRLGRSTVPTVMDFQYRPFQSLNKGRGDGTAPIQWGRGADVGGIGRRRRSVVLLPGLEVGDEGWDGPSGPRLMQG